MPTTATTTHLCAAALAHAARGWHVFPLRPDDKRPAVRDWANRATVDPDRVTRCWASGPYNIGIACGPSRLVVVDLDVPKPGQTPPPEWDMPGVNNGGDVLAVLADRAARPYPADTYTVRTGRGGTHLYYRHPDGGPELRNTTGSLGWLVDTRAHGGYVVAAGSTVAGRPYTVEWDADPAPLPGWLAGVLAPRPVAALAPVTVELSTDRRGGYLRAALDRSARAVLDSADGRHNAALFGAACSLGELVAGGELNGQDVIATLLPAAMTVGQPEGEALRTIRSGLRHGTRRPRSVAE